MFCILDLKSYGENPVSLADLCCRQIDPNALFDQIFLLLIIPKASQFKEMTWENMLCIHPDLLSM